ncbi:hypothetical protein Y032_0967g3240 [Ancylostoma ceylanicum]|nr:hypothetical protein Y032_0967g3240 [Ancylostoma ceylanicum]
MFSLSILRPTPQLLVEDFAESRCPHGRIEFLLVKRADVPSFGVSVGVKSVRNCMKECVDTNLFYCKSSQFEPVTSECFVSDECSDVAVSSASLDMYEAFCSLAAEGAASCNRPYSYEKLITSRLIGATEIERMINETVENCLSACSIFKGKCRSVNYDVSTRSCSLLSKGRIDGASITEDDRFDYYEPACLEETNDTTTTQASGRDDFMLMEANRTLRQEFRTVQLLQTGNLTTCWMLCQNATRFLCLSFAYSETKHECVVSSEKVEFGQFYERFTQKSPIFDLYVRVGDSENTLTTPRPNNNNNNNEVPFPTLIHDSAMRQAFVGGEGNIFDLSSTLFVQDNKDKGRTSSEATTTLASSTSAGGSAAALSPKYLARENRVDEKPESLTAFGESLGPNTSVDDLKHTALITDPELQQLSDYESVPRLSLPSERIGFVHPDKVKVRADCHDTGMNVSFHIDGKSERYTGAVYAAERFEQCRIFLRSSNNFAIFIPRPQHNPWCNALEIDKVVSVVIVMSNDRVLPHDVTTKDDLFFHVTCNYSVPVVDKIRQGIVVG